MTTRFSGPGPADHLGAQLLVAPAEHVALAADDRDDDAGGPPVEQVEQLRLAQIEARRPSVLDRIDAEERALDAEVAEDSSSSSCPGRRA